ncbi:ABC transporter ATP-binding protein [Actinomadura parmotrematis]|uniref:ABC transporter ATP-binding protein/permease n=1 Tax=Actinomadura parmotrematis TaxID=2864039 RepID=A0ABS7FTH3_9ACTN|nr:ABC transporter ATP-binding protein [Actinomadura parmotrematis]MBW8483710.1 ABC transporter ATP-binding protein/permease [Actinomadura parmotrematis]
MRPGDRLVARTVRGAGPWQAVLAVAVLGGAALQLALPAVLGHALDALTGGRGDARLPLCAAVVGGLVLCETAEVWAAGASGARASSRLRGRALRAVLWGGPATTRRFTEGDLVTRAGVNAEEVGRAPDALVSAAALAVPTLGALAALALLDPWLPAVLLAGLVLITLVLRGFLRDSTAVAGGYQRLQGEIAARFTGALGGAATIAAAGTAGRETARVLAPLPALREHALRLWRANARAGVRTGVTVPLLEIAVLAVGGWRLSAGALTVGGLYAAARYAVLGAGLSGALGGLGRLARARAAAGRLAELLDQPPVAHGDRTLPAGPGTLEFRDVSAPGLTGVAFTVAGGTATAVVGRSGSGKSLLAELAGRLADPAAGAVLLDGVPLPELARAELRRAVGYAFERPVLVGATLADAIGLGTGDPGRVPDAARAACADGFVRRLPRGYATPVAEAPMSGGERQRVGLARAIAQGGRLLVLDDATSSLDTVTERQVSAALTGGGERRTRLIVAHRPATARAADQVVWIDAGRVRAAGTHEELWRDPGYRAVFQEGA